MAPLQARLLGILDAAAAAFWPHPWRAVVPGLWLLALPWWVIEPRRVVLASSTCDFEQSFFIGLVLLFIGGWAVWKRGTQ
jgi:hypothetical protein